MLNIRNISVSKNESSPMAYPLVHQLLSKCIRYCGTDYDEINERIEWARIGNNAYQLVEIDEYFESASELSANVRWIWFLGRPFII